MPDRAHRARFPPEPRDLLRVERAVLGQELHGDAGPQALVLRLVHGAHPALPDQAAESILALEQPGARDDVSALERAARGLIVRGHGIEAILPPKTGRRGQPASPWRGEDRSTPAGRLSG